mmetsp:Transcript_67002/g.151456  ORF Transcript_67002/g.151456 Transcript_67002/m.151456 type:complete len:96 (-) Transcript_67002:477-764(-)
MSSACVPCSTTAPPPITTILSALTTVARRCAMTRVVRPRAQAARAASTSRSDWVSRAEVASSSRRSRGFETAARASAIRCFCPPESCTPRSPTSV